MNINGMIPGQLWVFAISIIYGGITGLWYEIFRVLRRRFSHPDFFVHLEDICFSLSVMAGLFFLLQIYNYGRIRMYVILGMVCGILLYYLLFCQLFGNIAGVVFDRLLWLFCIIGSFIISPFKFIIKSLVKTLKKTGRTVRIVKSRI